MMTSYTCASRVTFFFFLQVFYYLGELNDSLSYALGAGPLFDVSEYSDYVHTLLGMNLTYNILLVSYEYFACRIGICYLVITKIYASL